MLIKERNTTNHKQDNLNHKLYSGIDWGKGK